MLFVAVILFVIFGVWLKNQEQTTPTEPSSVSISHSQDSVLSSQSDTDSSTVLAETHSAQAPLASDSQPLPSGTKTHFESTESRVSQSAARTDEGISASNHSRSSFDKQIESSSIESSLIREPQDTVQAQDKTKLEVNALDATSFYDDLDVKDDEVDEIKSDVMDELAEFPESARNVLNDLFDVIDQAMRIKNQFSHIVVKGDTLKDILELSGLEAQVSEGLIQDYAELKKLKPGQQFYWILDNQGELEYLNWLVSEREERIYERTEDGKFKRDILKKQSVWKQEVLKDQIDGSFNTTLRTLGLEARQINQLVNALQWQINLKRLRKGDKFALLVTREYIDNKLTGQGNVDGIHIISGGKSYYAIQANNGRYYNRQGETLGKGFARYPLQRQARVSSHFNPYRRHPVTGRIAPHKGVDFAMPIGTPIIAPAEGVVEKVAYQANGAGRYIVIRHGREYQTVYMHLSRPLVRAGQSVKRGERIALSGNTGRSTGPHLHYEFHINGRAVNPLTVKLPGTSSGMGTAERKTFLIRAKEVERKLKL
ncbi:murein DD-endopeptidase MepM [Pasteurella sp. P03HT]